MVEEYEHEEFYTILNSEQDDIHLFPTKEMRGWDTGQLLAHISHLQLSYSKILKEKLSRVETRIKQQPQNPKGYYKKGARLLSLGAVTEAIDSLKVGLDLSPSNTKIQAKLNEAIDAQNTEDPIFSFLQFVIYLENPTAANLQLVEKYIPASLLLISASQYKDVFPLLIRDILLYPEIEDIAMQNIGIWILNFASIGFHLVSFEELDLTVQLLNRSKHWINLYMSKDNNINYYYIVKYAYVEGYILTQQQSYDLALKIFSGAILMLLATQSASYNSNNLLCYLYISASQALYSKELYYLANACYCAADYINFQLKQSHQELSVLKKDREDFLYSAIYCNFFDAPVQHKANLSKYAIESFVDNPPIDLVRPICTQRHGAEVQRDLEDLVAMRAYLQKKHPNSEEYAKILLLLGIYTTGNREVAKDIFRECMEVAEISLSLKVYALFNLGWLGLVEYSFSAALSYIQQAFVLGEESNDVHLMFHTNKEYAFYFLRKKSFHEGMPYLLKCVQICTQFMSMVALYLNSKMHIIEMIGSTTFLCLTYLKKLPLTNSDIWSESPLSDFNHKVFNFMIGYVSIHSEVAHRVKTAEVKDEDSYLRVISQFCHGATFENSDSSQDYLRKLVSVLPEDTAFVQYYVHLVKAKYYALIVLPNSTIKFVSVGKHQPITEIISQLNFMAPTANWEQTKATKGNPQIPASPHRNFPDDYYIFVDSDTKCNLYRELRKLIWDPVAQIVGKKRKILISRTDYLHFVPFEQLLTNSDSDYLASHYNFNYVTCTDYTRISSMKTDIPLGPPIVIADPNYDLGVVGPGCIPQGIIFPPLKGAQEEGIMCGRILGVTPIMRDDATKSVFFSFQKTPSVLHIATHATFEGVNNYIILAGANTVTRGGKVPFEVMDGVLESHLAGMLPLEGTKLVVLSACATGVGAAGAERMLGFPLAMLGAGARCVVVSVRPVDDAITKTFMECMYTKLVQEKSTVNEAVDSARKLLQNANVHVRDWSSFIIVGCGEIRL